MTFQSTRLRWARRLLRAKYFVVLTEKGSVIALDGRDPKSLEDTVAMAAQRASLLKFKDSLNQLIKEHDAVISGNTPRVTKIKVKKAH